jgi:hypothetical protein
VVDLLHERAVELELVDGQALEPVQRRRAHAEVVDREPHPHRVQLVEHVRVGGVELLCDLDRQVLGRHARAVQQRRHLGDEAGDAEHDRRHVDRDGHAQAAGDGQRLREHLACQPVQGGAAADVAQQRGRALEAALRVPATHERLDAGGQAGAQADLRLEVHDDLAARDGAAQAQGGPPALQLLLQHILTGRPPSPGLHTAK